MTQPALVAVPEHPRTGSAVQGFVQWVGRATGGMARAVEQLPGLTACQALAARSVLKWAGTSNDDACTPDFGNPRA